MLLSALVGVLECGSLTPLQMSGLLGHIQWFNLLNRALFCLLAECYTFARRQPQKCVCALPTKVMRELACVMCTASFWSFGMQKPWLPCLLASDASQVFGFGVSMCRASVDLVRDLGRHSEKRGDFITLDGAAPGAPDRLGKPRHVPIAQSRFSTVISARARFAGHPGLLEAHAIRLALEWISRSADRLGHRVVLLVDAKAILGAVAKGRSSARSLRRIVARISTLCLATNTTLQLLYVPSEHNPADAPSRGKVAPRDAKRKVRFSPSFQKKPGRNTGI